VNRRGPLVRAAWLLVPPLVLLAVAELVAALVAPASFGASDSLRVGALLERDEARGGMWVRLAGERARDVFVPDPSGKRRVVLLGGSSTQGFPEDVLERRLAAASRGASGPAPGTAADAEPGWEVFNLGRAGYGSWRVRRVLERALELAPDVVVVYCGHNEFVEAGFVREREGQVSVGGRRWYEHLRTFQLMASWFREGHAARAAAPDGPPGRELHPVEPDDVRAWVTSYEMTQRVYARYARNLEAMVEVARAAGVRVLLCTVIGNDFAGPKRSRCPEGADAARFDALAQRAVALLPPRTVDSLASGVRLDGPDWGLGLDADRAGAPPEGPGPAWEPPALRPLSGAFAPAPRTHGSKQASVAGAHWTDPAGWSADVPLVLETYAALVAGAADPDERERLERADALLGDALAVCPDHAHGLWLAGLVRHMLGDAAGAAERLARAHRRDWAPSRANDVTNGIVRDLAARLDDPGVRLLDLEALARGRCPDGLVGYEILLDECHLHPGVRPVIMEDVAAALAAWERDDPLR